MKSNTRQLPFDRSQRIADQIHSIVSMACLTQISDKRLDGVNITYVTATKDLRLLRINFFMEDATPEKIKLAIKGFHSASGFLKQAINREVELKFMPNIQFFFDEGLKHFVQMDELISGLAKSSSDEGSKA